MKKIYLLLAFTLIMGASNAQVIAAGWAHSISICADSTVMAEGNNDSGQLGENTTTNSNLPVSVSNLTGIITVSCGWNHSLALKSDGTVWAWGRNSDGQLGNGTNTNSSIPVQVSGLTGVVDIAGGGEHCLAVKTDGTVWAWGSNSSGELGDGTTTASNIPVLVSGSAGFDKVAGGAGHSLALKNDGTVWGFGSNGVGELGNGTNASSNIPVLAITLPGVTEISCGQNHSSCLNGDSTVSAWGDASFGQLGNGTITNSNVPTLVNTLTNITYIAQGNMALHGLALKDDGTIWLWGHNGYGQLGNGSIVQINSPIQLTAPTGITEVAVGNVHSMVTKDDGSVWIWGWNLYGNLGNGGNTDVYTPLEITAVCDVLVDCQVTYGTDEISACDTYDWIDGITYTADNNIATHSLTNAMGCDSIVTLDLTILSSSVYAMVAAGVDSYTAPSGAVYTSSGLYSDTIPNAAGCDSVITIDLSLQFTGIEEYNNEYIQLSPNPASDAINIQGINDLVDVQEIKLISMMGSILLESNSILETIDVSNLARGVYYIHITHSLGVESVPFVKE